MRYIGLADCNNFFVSCERVFRPDLWGKPVVVLSSNDGAIVARSQEVKDLGVPMGVPYFKVRDIIEAHSVAVFSSNFDLYRDMSGRVMTTLREELGEIDQYSVDEAFFELEVSDLDAALTELVRLRQVVLQHVGVPLSFGLAPTKTIAKYASEREKRGSGACVMDIQAWRRLAPEVKLSDLWGVGGAMSRRFREQGLDTAADYVAADRARIEKLFGVYGVRLQAELCGQSVRSDRDDTLPKSIMSTRSFAKTTTELAVLEEALAYHVARAAEELRQHEAVAGRINILILTSRHGDWHLRGGSSEALLPLPTSDTTLLLKEAKRLARTLFEAGVPYKKAGVVLGAIRPKEAMQPDLFGTSAGNEALMETIDQLNHRIGSDTVTIGRAKYQTSWSNRHEYRSPCYTTSWNQLPVVSACNANTIK